MKNILMCIQTYSISVWIIFQWLKMQCSFCEKKFEYKTCSKANQVFWMISRRYRCSKGIRIFKKKKVLFFSKQKKTRAITCYVIMLLIMPFPSLCNSIFFICIQTIQAKLLNQTKWLKKLNLQKWTWRPVNQDTTKARIRGQV